MGHWRHISIGLQVDNTTRWTHLGSPTANGNCVMLSMAANDGGTWQNVQCQMHMASICKSILLNGTSTTTTSQPVRSSTVSGNIIDALVYYQSDKSNIHTFLFKDMSFYFSILPFSKFRKSWKFISLFRNFLVTVE